MNRKKEKIDLFVIESVKEQLADEVGFSNTFISERESGIKRYNISHLNKLAIALKCSPKDFLPNEPFKEDAKK